MEVPDGQLYFDGEKYIVESFETMPKVSKQEQRRVVIENKVKVDNKHRYATERTDLTPDIAADSNERFVLIFSEFPNKIKTSPGLLRWKQVDDISKSYVGRTTWYRTIENDPRKISITVRVERRGPCEPTTLVDLLDEETSSKQSSQITTTSD